MNLETQNSNFDFATAEESPLRTQKKVIYKNCEKQKLALLFFSYMFTACLQLCVLMYCIVLPVDGNSEAFVQLYNIVPTIFLFHIASMVFLLIELVFYLVTSLQGKQTMTIMMSVYLI